MDSTSVIGIVVAIGCILVGHTIEGGNPAQLLQLTAAMIVLGGTFGAVALAMPRQEFMRGLRMAKGVFSEKRSDADELIAQIVEFAGVARRDGVLALEQQLDRISDAFLKRAIGFLVDGVDAAIARDSLETQIYQEYEDGVVGARVFESAGGFAPTIGILGAVLGLMHVMDNLTDPSRLGSGIATAFVSTVYGVGSANIIFLPIASKLKRKLAIEKQRKILIAEGVLSIQAGLNPRVLEDKLQAYAGGQRGEAAA